MQDRLANRVELGVTSATAPQQQRLPVAPAYQDEDVVEYYAVKQEQWIRARMQVDLSRPSLLDNTSSNIHYNVLIGNVSKQLREDVPLDVLRPPLQHDEPVEVFSLKTGGSWMSAFINSLQTGDTNNGYNIRLHPGGQELKRIPAVRLRRRYLAKMPVKIYKGPDLGWRRMVVHPLAGKDGTGAEGLRIAEASPQLQSRSTPAEPWTLVPVCGEKEIADDDSEGSEDEFDLSKVPEPEWYPSYLIRATNLDASAPSSPSMTSPTSAIGASIGWCGADDKRRKKQESVGACSPIKQDGADASGCSPTVPANPFAACGPGEEKSKKQGKS